MESSEVRLRSVIASVALFGAGTVVGASATWLIMSMLGGPGSNREGGRSRLTTTPGMAAVSGDGDQKVVSKQRCGQQLRSILADLEIRLMDAIDELVAHFSISTQADVDQTSKKPCLRPSSAEVRRSASQLEGIHASQHHQHVGAGNERNLNNSSASITRRLFSQVDRLFEGSVQDRERALELLKAKEEQLSQDVNFVWRLAKATHFKSKIESERDKNEQKRLAYLARDLAARSLEMDTNSAAAHKWFAITTGVVGDYESPKVRIQSGFLFEEHVRKAMTLNPKDPTNHYLLGRWCYGVYALTWVEKKLASTLYTTMPSATVDDALQHFLKAEKMNPGMFKENLLYIGKLMWRVQCYVEKKDYKTAAQWLQKAAKVPVNGMDDEICQKEVDGLLTKYKRYAETIQIAN